MLAMMGFRSKSSTVEAAPVSEGLLPIVRDRLQEEVFEKSKGKFLCTIDLLGSLSWIMAFSESSDVLVVIVPYSLLIHSFIHSSFNPLLESQEYGAMIWFLW